MEKNKQPTHFNEVANTWDSKDKIALMRSLAVKTKEALKLKGKLDILDFGCGTGLFGLEFLDHAKTLTGVDTSEGMLKVFDEKTKGVSGASRMNVDLEKESLTGAYDLILSSMAFHHLANPSLVLGKLRKSLRPGGKIVIVDLRKEDGTFHPDNDAMGVKHFGFSEEELLLWAKENSLLCEVTTINELDKNNRKYRQFMAVFA